MTESTWNVITDSLSLLRNAAMLVSGANADAPTPCSAWTVTQVLQHAAGDQLAWAGAIGVGTGPAENPFMPSGVLKGSVDELIEPALATAAVITPRAATADEVKDLRREAQALKEVVADLTLENRLLKKSMIADGGDE